MTRLAHPPLRSLARQAMLEGNLEEAIGYVGAGVALISEILSVAEVFKGLTEGSDALIKRLA